MDGGGFQAQLGRVLDERTALGIRRVLPSPGPRCPHESASGRSGHRGHPDTLDRSVDRVDRGVRHRVRHPDGPPSLGTSPSRARYCLPRRHVPTRHGDRSLSKGDSFGSPAPPSPWSSANPGRRTRMWPSSVGDLRLHLTFGYRSYPLVSVVRLPRCGRTPARTDEFWAPSSCGCLLRLRPFTRELRSFQRHAHHSDRPLCRRNE